MHPHPYETLIFLTNMLFSLFCSVNAIRWVPTKATLSSVARWNYSRCVCAVSAFQDIRFAPCTLKYAAPRSANKHPPPLYDTHTYTAQANDHCDIIEECDNVHLTEDEESVAWRMQKVIVTNKKRTQHHVVCSATNPHRFTNLHPTTKCCQARNNLLPTSVSEAKSLQERCLLVVSFYETACLPKLNIVNIS